MSLADVKKIQFFCKYSFKFSSTCTSSTIHSSHIFLGALTELFVSNNGSKIVVVPNVGEF